MQISQDVLQQGLLASPGVAYTTLTFAGYSINNIIAVGTGVLVLLQIGYVIHKWVLMLKEKRKEKRKARGGTECAKP